MTKISENDSGFKEYIYIYICAKAVIIIRTALFPFCFRI